MRASKIQPAQEPWRQRLHTIIFEADTPGGKAFDVLLLISIVASVIVVMLDSVSAIRARYGPQITALEWGFTSIPTSIYWAVVTLTTVGDGDIAPQTALGKAVAVVVMLLGYGIIAVPTGIVTMELSRAATQAVSTQACPACGAEGHDVDARYCRRCGSLLEA